jgi:hypothetical protein
MHVSRNFSPLETPKIEKEVGDAAEDFGDLKVKHAKNILKLTTILIERIIVRTQKLKISMKGRNA